MDTKGASLVLLSIFLFQLIPLLAWIHEDNSPPSWDQSWHAMISLNRFNQIFSKNPLPTSQVEETYPIFRFVNNFYPPLYHTATIPFHLFFGKTYDAALATNTLFLLILTVSSFYIGKKIHSPEAGLLIAFIVSTIPGYNLLMRDYLIDFPLVSMVSLGFALLLYTENFQNTAYSLWFGIALGLGMLTKWTYGAFLFLPICLSVLKSLGRSVCERRGYRPLGNACLSFVAAFVVMSTWYTFSHLSVLVPLVATASFEQGIVEGEPSFDSFEGLTYYFFVTVHEYSLLYFGFFAGSVIVFAMHQKKYACRDFFVMCLVTAVFVYSLFTVVLNKNTRYIEPAFLFLASATGIGVFLVENAKLRRGAIILLLGLGVVQNIALVCPRVNADYRIGEITVFDFRGKYPVHSDVDIERFLSEINESDGGRYFSVCVASESALVNDGNIPYYALRGGYPVHYMIGNGCNPLEFTYTIVGPIEETWRSYLFEKSKKILEENRGHFNLIYTSSGVSVYERI